MIVFEGMTFHFSRNFYDTPTQHLISPFKLWSDWIIATDT